MPNWSKLTQDTLEGKKTNAKNSGVTNTDAPDWGAITEKILKTAQNKSSYWKDSGVTVYGDNRSTAPQNNLTAAQILGIDPMPQAPNANNIETPKAPQSPELTPQQQAQQEAYNKYDTAIKQRDSLLKEQDGIDEQLRAITGRASVTGKGVTFANANDEAEYKRLEQRKEEIADTLATVKTPSVTGASMERAAGAYLNLDTAFLAAQEKLQGGNSEIDNLINNSIYAGYATDDLTRANMAQYGGTTGEPTSTEAAQKQAEIGRAKIRDANAKLQAVKDNTDAIGGFLIDAYSTGLDIAADTVVSLATLGIGGQVAMAARVFGMTAAEAADKGDDLQTQTAKGLTAAAIEVLTEKIGGAFETAYGKTLINKLGGTGLGKAVSTAIDKIIPTPAGKAFVKFLSEAGGEGAEEALSDILNTAADHIFGWAEGDKTFAEDVKADADQIIYDALLGAFVGAFGAGGNAIKAGRGGNANTQQQNTTQQQGSEIDNLVNAATRQAPQRAQESTQAITQQQTQPVQQTEPTAQGAQFNSNTENEGGASTSNKTEAKANTKEIVAKLKDSIPALENDEPVKELTGNEFARGEKRLGEQVADFFRSIGNKVQRRTFGDVILDNRGIKDDIAHGIGRAKAITFAAVPDVIAQGKQIDYQENWKGRGYNSYVFAAPIKIGNNTSYVAAVVLQDKANRFYLHEVIDGNGNLIYKIDNTPNDIKTGLPQGGVTGGVEGVTEVSSNNSISNPAENVNAENGIPSEAETNAGEENIEDALRRTQTEESPVPAKRSIEERVKRRLDYWKRQTQQTKEKFVRERDADKVAKRLIDETGSLASKADVSEGLQQMGNYLIRNDGANLNYDTLNELAHNLADDILSEATDSISPNPEMKSYLKDYFNGMKIDVGRYKNDIDSDFAGFRRRYSKIFKFSSTNGTPIDSIYSELSASFPGVFGEDVVNPADMMLRIAEVWDGLEDYEYNPYGFGEVYDSAVDELAAEIMDSVLSDEIREEAPTYADRKQAEIARIRAEKNAQLEAVKQQGRERLEAQKEKTRAAKEQAAEQHRADMGKLKELRETKNAKIKETAEQGRARLANEKERQKAKQERNRINKLVKDFNKRILHPTEGRYIPAEYMRSTIDAMQSIQSNIANLEEIAAVYDSRIAESATNEEAETWRLKKQKAIEQAAKNETKFENIVNDYSRFKSDEDYNYMYDDAVAGLLNSINEYVGSTPISQMTSEQLKGVYTALKAIDTQAKTAVKIKIDGEEHDAFELSKQMASESKRSPSKNNKLNNVFEKYAFMQMRPETAFAKLGNYVKNSAWTRAYNILNEGQRKATALQVKGEEMFSTLLRDTKQLNNLRNEVDIGLKNEQGEPVKISRGMMLSLYMHLMNEGNARHITRGGLTIAGNIADYYKQTNDSGFGKGRERVVGVSPELTKLRYEYRQIEKEIRELDKATVKDIDWQSKVDNAVDRLDNVGAEIDALLEKEGQSAEQMLDAIENQLTDYEREWLETARTFFDDFASVELNKTAMDVYGFKKANVENYFPIQTDSNFRNASVDAVTRDINIENAGFMQERKNASNPIMLLDIADVINSHNRKVAQYSGLMPAIREFGKVWGKTGAGFSMSLRDSVTENFGKAGTNYVENLLADLQGGRPRNDNALLNLLGATRSNVAAATLTLNPGVALGQTASYPTAAAEIGWEPLAKALARMDKVDKELIAQYSPLLKYRASGGATVELGDLKNDAHLGARIFKKLDFLTNWISTMDEMTVSRLWYASQYYVDEHNKTLKKGSDEYYQEVGKVFDRVVERTQPNYTTMQRPDILRNPDNLLKSLTMFTTQRFQNANILMEAAGRLTKYSADAKSGINNVTEADVKSAREDFGRAIASQLVASATFVVFKSLTSGLLHDWDKFRDKDGDITAESVGYALLDMFGNTIFGIFLGGDIAYSAIKSIAFGDRFYGLSMTGVDALDDFVTDTVNLMKNDDPKKAAGKWGKVAKDLSVMFGIPVNNAEKIINGVQEWVADFADGNGLDSTASHTKTQNARRIVKAYLDGDTEKADTIAEELGDETASKVKSYIKGTYLSGKMSADDAAKVLAAYGGFDSEKAARKQLENWSIQDMYSDMIKGMDANGNGSTTQAEIYDYYRSHRDEEPEIMKIFNSMGYATDWTTFKLKH